jgi:DNA mismatch repair protein MutL
VELACCHGERGPLAVEAFLSRPEAARTGAQGLRVFVNGRPVRDRAVMATIAHAYGSVLERGRYPRGVVYLELPFELVDVNVHPQKTEVRFADPRAVTDALHGMLVRELASAFSLPPRRVVPAAQPQPEPRPARDSQPSPDASPPAELRAPAVAPRPVASPDSPLPWEPAARPARVAPELAVPHDEPERGVDAAMHAAYAARALESTPPVLAVRDSGRAPAQPSSNVSWSSLKFIAQLRQTYLLCEGPDGIYLLDQHAAAERVTFTRLRRSYESRKVPSQALLFPVIVDVSAEEAELVERRSVEIAEVGLDARMRGPEAVSIHAVPKLLARGNPERLLRDLLAEVSRKSERAFSDAIDLALATMACHGSIRAGDPLSPGEAGALLSALDDADFAGHCPHGRPVVTFIGWTELERKVGRR